MQNTTISAIEKFDPVALFSEDPTDRDIFAMNFRQGDKMLEPEKRLMLAVLKNAIECLKKPKLRQETQEWIASKNTEYLFSFENICEELGYDPEYLRKRLYA